MSDKEARERLHQMADELAATNPMLGLCEGPAGGIRPCRIPDCPVRVELDQIIMVDGAPRRRCPEVMEVQIVGSKLTPRPTQCMKHAGHAPYGHAFAFSEAELEEVRQRSAATKVSQ